MSVIIGSLWFTSARGCVGIVLVKPVIGDEKAYIGIVDGEDQERDEKYLAEYGTSFPALAAQDLIKGRKP